MYVQLRSLTLTTSGSLVFQNITLGGRLYHTESMQSVTESDESTYTEKKMRQASANLGIPHANFEFNFTKEKNFEAKTGEKSTDRAEFLSWNGVGGNSGLVVEYVIFQQPSIALR